MARPWMWPELFGASTLDQAEGLRGWFLSFERWSDRNETYIADDRHRGSLRCGVCLGAPIGQPHRDLHVRSRVPEWHDRCAGICDPERRRGEPDHGNRPVVRGLAGLERAAPQPLARRARRERGLFAWRQAESVR